MLLILVAGLAAAGPPRPVPIDMQSWFVNDDYPAAAIRAGKEGKVGYRLNVDAAGVVTGCAITASSGSALLDAPTCELLRKRARFQPARDRKGRAIASAWKSGIRWVLPTASQSMTTTTAPGFVVTTYEAASDGKLLSCRTVGEHGMRVHHDPCAGPPPSWIGKYARAYRTLRLQAGNAAVNMPASIPAPDWGQAISRRLDILSWSGPGLVACDVIASEGPPDVGPGLCSTNTILPKEPGEADSPVVKLAIGWAIYGVRR